ncbi:MerR family transcriptional regulator [Truepera radiovictrix]|uniref:Transcriptional regulator, MerR family n=1 Tax=Truepera radiovictrix (strain DSM 17093 / CIP 108686 / LMG 22925 / RQ-24) TaxID=649638 RepID=D7CTM0_TRURR|nr:MerR family transcriptional regulator [Truepera radiovictrix]ADI13877.1 transcriptional regulator, MerR family [Truepera radiovictrix DSM 17093]WMT57559.1 MerR family transcriptional regulator [Truepera radiovictrix]
MFKIGDFAKLTRVSVKTLHHYDDIGLFKPAYVDPATGYRFYSFEQLPRLNRILVLKALGFSLEQVAKLLEEALSSDDLQGMLRLRQAALEQQVEEARTRLREVSARLYQIQREGKMPEHEVVLKTVAPVWIASARETVLEPERMRERCLALLEEVFGAVEANALAATPTTLALYHDGAEGVDVEMAVFLEPQRGPQQYGRVRVRELPAARMASAVYKGSFNAFEVIGQLHADLGRWLEARGYRVCSPSRELYLQPPEDYSQDGVMELQYPVTKG